ncbi:predicted protein [Naegleria gruberi]|uniref:Predicted protein n=1 Tax=Naegleria gruberi TaxID=5762 RepID=D2V1I9_NAEGR|nr:uncharacterized protein NAEGRDRAFT_62596 [Naegleria gruberi]EFC49316.1 predicted protein [Naegleria gruberi]|eukprot:XP_002682060.1 predicted protein [Naegleria gruberi strain NEG-M]
MSQHHVNDHSTASTSNGATIIEGVFNFCDIMSNTKLSDHQNSKQLCLYYNLDIDEEEDFVGGEFRMLKFNSESNLFNIKQIEHSQHCSYLAVFLIDIYGINYLYYLNYSKMENASKFIRPAEQAKKIIGHDLFNDSKDFIGIQNEYLKLLPFQFRKNEHVIKIDTSGTLMKTNLNSIWDITGSVISINNNILEHLIFDDTHYNVLLVEKKVKYIDNFNDEIVDFDCNGHSVFTTKSGKVYGYGYNTYRQLNLDGEDDNIIEFLSDISFDSLPIKKVMPGPYKTHFITESGALYASGVNSNYVLGCSEGKTKQEIYDYIASDVGQFHSYPACKCDLIDEKYEIQHVYPIGYDERCIFLTKDKKLLMCGKYFDENGTEIISVGDIYPLDGEIDQLFSLGQLYLLVITKDRKVHVVGKRKIDTTGYRPNWVKKYLAQERFIDQVKQQVEILLSLDERIFGKLHLYPNRFDFGCVLKMEMSLDLLSFFKSLRQGMEQGNFSDLTFTCK